MTAVKPLGWPSRAVVVTVAVDRPDHSPGMVAALLEHLDRRQVASTWFVPQDVDPALIDRLFYTGHEVAGLVPSLRDLGDVVRTLTNHDVGVTGVRVASYPQAPPVTFGVSDLVEQTASTGLTYVSIAADDLELPAVLDEASLTLLPAPTGRSELGTNPLAWLHATQLAVGRVVEHGGCHELSVDLSAVDRPDGLSAVAEAVDLVSGLRRAERLWVDRLDRLVAAMAPDKALPEQQ